MNGARLALVALVVAVLGTLPFLEAFYGGFVWDDVSLVQTNPRVQSLEHAERWLSSDLFDLEAEEVKRSRRLVFYRPLVLASLALDYRIGGGQPAVFHLTNLLLHAVVVALAFFVARGYCRSTLLSAVAALLFAVHPTKAESVAWISGRSDLLVTLGLLASMLGSRARLAGRTRWSRFGGGAMELLGFFVGALSKELVVVLPVLALFETLRGAGVVDRRRWLVGLGPSVTLVLGYLALRSALLPWGAGVARVSAFDHVRIVLETHGRALELLVWPQDLSVFRAAVRVAESGIVHSTGYEIGGAILLSASLLGALALARRAPLDAALGAGFVLLFAPTGNYFLGGEASWIAPRFLYLPVLPVLLLAVRTAGALGSSTPNEASNPSETSGPSANGPNANGRARWLSLALAVSTCAVLTTFGVLAARRVLAYRDQRAFFASELRGNADVPEVVLGAANVDLAEGESKLALARVACGHRAIGEQFRHSLLGGRFILVGLEALERELDDFPPEQLRALGDFLDAVASGRPAEVERPLLLSVTPGSKASEGMLVSPSRVLVLGARYRARAGDVRGARDLLARALASCGGCSEAVSGAQKLAPLLVDFGEPSDPESAERIALAYEERGLPGRALLTLAPVVRSVVGRPEGTRWVAELALKAGDAPLAKHLLARLPRAEADALSKRAQRPEQRYSPESRGGFVGRGCALADELFGTLGN